MATLLELIEDIRDSAVSPDHCSLATLLRKCRVVASKLGNRHLEDWIHYESNGYPDGVTVPDYRITAVNLIGHFSAIHGGTQLRDAPISVLSLPEGVREVFSKYKVTDSVALLEQHAQSQTGVVHLNYDALPLMLAQHKVKIYNNMECLQAWGEMSAGVAVHILETVRNRVLDFSLALEKESPRAAKGVADFSVEEERINKMVQTSIYGDQNIVLVGSNNFVYVSGVVKGDFNSLREVLSRNGLTSEDIDALHRALKSEPEATGGKFGTQVKKWMSGVISNVGKNAGDIAVNAVKGLLQKALEQYYGM